MKSAACYAERQVTHHSVTRIEVGARGSRHQSFANSGSLACLSTGCLQLKDVANETGLNKSTAYRFLAHLEHEAYVFRDVSGAYAIGVKLARLGSGVSYQATLCKIARPILQQLWEATGETVNLAVIDGHEVLYLDVIESRHTFRLVSQTGIRRPLYCTSLGKVMLAFAPDQQQEHLLSGLTFEPFTPHTARSPAQLRKEFALILQRGYSIAR